MCQDNKSERCVLPRGGGASAVQFSIDGIVFADPASATTRPQMSFCDCWRRVSGRNYHFPFPIQNFIISTFLKTKCSPLRSKIDQIEPTSASFEHFRQTNSNFRFPNRSNGLQRCFICFTSKSEYIRKICPASH